VPHYGRVWFEDVYPGIDMEYYSNSSQLQYNFLVAPGGDPTRIRLHFPEAQKLEIATNGDLVIYGPQQSVLRQPAPYSFQPRDSLREEVTTGFVLVDSQTVGFQVSAYDSTRSLVIDPPLVYSTYLGSETGSETSLGIVADADGNAYLTGQAQAAGFPTTPGRWMAPFRAIPTPS
jgi:hypothetical protein